jgi:hypothetical protein
VRHRCCLWLSILKTILSSAAVLVCALFSSSASAADIRLAWDPNPETDIAGYVVLYGTSSGTLTNKVDVGLVTDTTLTALADGTPYYVAVQAYNAAGTFSNPSAEVMYVTPSPTPVLTAVDLYGRMDFVWQNQSTGMVASWEMSGVNAASASLLASQPGSAWKVRAVGDLNRDESADIVWQHTDGWVAVWFMNGSAIRDTRYLSINRVTDTNWVIVGSSDFNNDGRSDIVWQHRTRGTVAIWLMWDNLVLDTRVIATVDPKWKLVGIGDLNHDHQPDFVWQHDDGWLAGWYIRNLAVSDTGYLSTSRLGDTNWRIRGLEDLNNDMRDDLIFQHQTTGELAAWFMDGVRVLDTRWISPSPISDLNWKLVGIR